MASFMESDGSWNLDPRSDLLRPPAGRDSTGPRSAEEAVGPLRFLLAEQAEALLLVLVLVLLSLAGTRVAAGRQSLSAARRRGAGTAARRVRPVAAGVQDGLDPGAHFLLQGATRVVTLKRYTDIYIYTYIYTLVLST